MARPISESQSGLGTQREPGVRFLILLPSSAPGKQLTYTYPLVYDKRLEGPFAEKFSDLVEVIKGHHVRQAPWNSTVTLTSQAGAAFQSFAKFGNFGDGESWV